MCNSFDDCDDKTDELNCAKVTLAPTKKPITNIVKIKHNDLINYEPKEDAVEAKVSDDDIIQDILNQNIENKKTEIEYDNYELMKQQSDIVDYLNSLISFKENKNKIVQKSPDDIFASFMKTKSVNFVKQTTPKPKTTTATTKKIIFHGINQCCES